MKEYLNEGLLLHTKIYYMLQRGKRIYTETKPEPEKQNDSWFEFEATIYPPLMLLPITWQRYGYTLEDVVSTYGEIDSHFIWQLSLMLLCGQYEPESASAGVRPTFQSLFTFLFISRKTVFDVFVSTQNQFISQKSGSILCHERFDHKPLLPKIIVPPEMFEEMKSMVPQRQPSFCWVQKYRKVIPFKDITLIPVEYDETNKLIYMVRAVTKAVYEAIEVKPKLCIVTLPIIILVNRQEYVLLEEACFFSLSHTQKKKDAMQRVMDEDEGEESDEKVSTESFPLDILQNQNPEKKQEDEEGRKDNGKQKNASKKRKSNSKAENSTVYRKKRKTKL